MSNAGHGSQVRREGARKAANHAGRLKGGGKRSELP